MGLPILKSKQRDGLGKSSTKKIRLKKLTPGVVYGLKQENRHVVIDSRDLDRLFRSEKQGRNVIMQLEIETLDGKVDHEQVMAYQIQRNTLTRNLDHIDFIRVSDTSMVRATVPILLEGRSPGIKMGGVLVQNLRQLVIKSLPQSIPEAIVVDMTKLKINDFFKVKDLGLDGVEIISNRDDTIVRITAPRNMVEDNFSEDETESNETGGTSDAE
jgi:large subunit ribosomal protein L25